MAEPLYELLTPYFDTPPSPRPPPSINDPVTSNYLNRLSTLPLASLTSTEPQSISQSTHSTLLSLQSLSARSHAAIIASSDHLSSLRTTLPILASEARNLQNAIPQLDSHAVSFGSKYSRIVENVVLDRRKDALLLSRNIDRLSDILDLPTLLSSAISSSTAQAGSSTANYASALDLHAHIKRLHLLYPSSPLINSIYAQTEEAMQEMTSSLISTLRVQNIKLAAAMRTIGWLRRVAPDLDSPNSPISAGVDSNKEGALGALFLICRLTTLNSMLNALSPLRDLADQETDARLSSSPQQLATTSTVSTWAHGQQTERYLKRYIEIFREQSFAIVSMYKSIFPSALDASNAEMEPRLKSPGLKTPAPSTATQGKQDDPLNPLPSALSTFPLHLISLLTSALKEYLPNVRDRSSRESLLTQVLYCAGSLGRLGGDFSLVLAELWEGDDSDEDRRNRRDGGKEAGLDRGEGNGKGVDEDEEWVEVMRKHRVLAGRLEAMAGGIGAGAKGKG